MLMALLLAHAFSAQQTARPCPNTSGWVNHHVCNAAEFKAANAVLQATWHNKPNSDSDTLIKALAACSDLDCVRNAYSDALVETLPPAPGCGGPYALQNETRLNELEVAKSWGGWTLVCLDITNGRTDNDGANFGETMIVGMANKRPNGTYRLTTSLPQCEIALQKVSSVVWRVRQSPKCSFDGSGSQIADGVYRKAH